MLILKSSVFFHDSDAKGTLQMCIEVQTYSNVNFQLSFTLNQLFCRPLLIEISKRSSKVYQISM